MPSFVCSICCCRPLRSAARMASMHRKLRIPHHNLLALELVHTKFRAATSDAFCLQLQKLDLALDCDLDPRDGTSGRYLVSDSRAMGELSGQLSPLTAVSVPYNMRARAGIPIEAASFAFAYPVQMPDSLSQMKTQPPWLAFLRFGGFCYFDAADKLVGVSVCQVVDAATPSKLRLVGPFEVTEGVCTLRAAGAHTMCARPLFPRASHCSACTVWYTT